MEEILNSAICTRNIKCSAPWNEPRPAKQLRYDNAHWKVIETLDFSNVHNTRYGSTAFAPTYEFKGQPGAIWIVLVSQEKLQLHKICCKQSMC